jgi:ABC-2 type transport system ATP-binding protein
MPEVVPTLHTLRAEADALRHCLGGEEAADALVTFAERYAVDPALLDQALGLKLRSVGGGESAPLADEQHRLLDAISSNFERGGGSAAMAERAQAEARATERLAREAPERGLAFSGRGLRKRYAGSDFAFGSLDLDLPLGEITGVVGQNAHGKTTLLRIVAGELLPDSGTLGYPALGEPGPRVGWAAVKRQIAFVPQELPAWRGSLLDTLHYEAAIHGVLGRDNEREVRFVVQRLGLTEHLGKRWAELAGGYRLRFALARALVWRPRLLIMDEPLANLDIKAKGVLLQDVRALAASYRQPIAVLMSSHELHSLEQVCGQMVFLNAGRVVYAGPVSGISREREGNEYEIGTRDTASSVRDRLAGSVVSAVREDGVNLLLSTARSVGAREMLELLLARGIEPTYFRDNSRSVRRLFE